jgi:hypothetical protein
MSALLSILQSPLTSVPNPTPLNNLPGVPTPQNNLPTFATSLVNGIPTTIPQNEEVNQISKDTSRTQYPGFPVQSDVPLPPPSLNRGLNGPVNTQFGLLSSDALIGANQNLGGLKYNGLDNITESTLRTVCNSTSQLAALLCNDVVADPNGGLGSILNGSNNNIVQGCVASRYGCCADLTTNRLNEEGSNCEPNATFQNKCGIFGCCPGTNFSLKRANLIGTNCPQGAVPLVGWDFNSTQKEKNAAGLGYRDPRYLPPELGGEENVFITTNQGEILSPSEQQSRLSQINNPITLR